MQCKWGHVVCSRCRDKLRTTGRCHTCGVAYVGNSQCDAMERLENSIRFPCPNAVHGCTTRTTYYDRHYHHQTCQHLPCHCPGEACGFVGSLDMLVDHFEAAHGWPCATMARAAATDDVDEEGETYTFDVSLQDGFNFLLAECPTDGILYLLLLNVVRQPHGCTISVLCIYPDNDESKEMEESTFTVDCTDLSDGKPRPDECFQFVVPKSFLPDGDTVKVEGQIIITY
nr:unnamed protein product [Digitaria exilis]